MKRLYVWQATGRLREPDERPSKAMTRTVQFALPFGTDFHTAAEHAEAALLSNWSSKPHVVEIRTMFTVMEDGDHKSIYVQDSRDPRVDRLLHLILEDMPAATNSDLAADGHAGDEEGEVWKRIEALARELALWTG